MSSWYSILTRLSVGWDDGLNGRGQLGCHGLDHGWVYEEGGLTPSFALLLCIISVGVVRASLVFGQGVQSGEVTGPVTGVVQVWWDAAVCEPDLEFARDREISGPALCRCGPVGTQVLPEKELVLGQLSVQEVDRS